MLGLLPFSHVIGRGIYTMPTALGTAQSSGLIMAAISAVFTTATSQPFSGEEPRKERPEMDRPPIRRNNACGAHRRLAVLRPPDV